MSGTLTMRYTREPVTRLDEGQDLTHTVEVSDGIESVVQAFRVFLYGCGYPVGLINSWLLDEESESAAETLQRIDREYALTPEGEAWLDRVRERNDPAPQQPVTCDGYSATPAWPFPVSSVIESDAADPGEIHIDPARED